MKQKIVVDTNVLVSALISDSYPSRIVKELIFEKKVKICVSAEIWQEYLEVLSREKFSRYQSFFKNARIVLNKIEELAVKFKPKIKIDEIDDQPDNRFLELAVASNAKYLITGNTKDFNFDTFRKIKIVTPKEFWEIHQKGRK